MEKQKRQLAVLVLALIAAVIVFVILSKASDRASQDASEDNRFVINDIQAENVIRFAFTNSAGTVSLTKNAQEWIYEDDRTLDIDESKVAELIQAVAPLDSENRIEEVEDLDMYGLSEPTWTILVSDGNQVCTIMVGDLNEITGTYYLCLEDENSVVYDVDQDIVRGFGATLEDLTIAEEETTQVESTEVEE